MAKPEKPKQQDLKPTDEKPRTEPSGIPGELEALREEVIRLKTVANDSGETLAKKDKLLSALDEELKLHKSILEEMETELRTLREAASKSESVIEERDRLKVRVSVLESAASSPALPESGWSSPRARELVQAVSVVDQPYLLGDLLALLAPHAGETGANETATDVLRRKLAQMEALQHAKGESETYAASLYKQCDAYERQLQTIQAALVARRAPDAESSSEIAAVVAVLQMGLPMGWRIEGKDGKPPSVAAVVQAVVSEWTGLRAFFSDKPLVALAVKDESTPAVADRFSLLLLEWDGKRLSPTALETVRPWGDIHPRLQHMLNTRLVPKPFR